MLLVEFIQSEFLILFYLIIYIGWIMLTLQICVLLLDMCRPTNINNIDVYNYIELCIFLKWYRWYKCLHACFIVYIYCFFFK